MGILGRIGQIRGPERSTLDDVVAGLALVAEKLDALLALDNTASIAAIADAIGTRADCVSGKSVIGLLCEISDGIIGDSGAYPPEGATCPGFEGAIAGLTVTSWTETTVIGFGGTGSWFANYSVTGSSPNLSTFTSVVDEAEPGTNRSAFKSDTDLTNICVGYSAPDTGYAITVDVQDVDTDAIIYSAPIKTDLLAGAGSETFSINASQYLTIVAFIPAGTLETAPGASVWVTQGPFG